MHKYFPATALSCFLTAVFSAAAQTFVPQSAVPGFIIGQEIGAGVRGIISSNADLASNKEQLAAKIAAARARFWAAYPDGADLAAAGEDFARLLFAKDFLYLMIYLPEGPHTQMAKNLAASGSQLDGGIPRSARPEFYEYIDKLRQTLGARKSNPLNPNEKPDLVVALPNTIFRAHENPEVQAAYNAYRANRDRAELVAANRLNEFEDRLAKARGPIQVSPPKTQRVSFPILDANNKTIYIGGLSITYGDVPEDFVPAIETPFSDDVKYLLYSMSKRKPESLSDMKVFGFFTPNRVGTREMYETSRHPQRSQIIFQDAQQIRSENGALLACEYLTTSNNTRTDRYYWYKTRPAAADPAQLKTRLSNHPLLVVGDPKDTCPWNLSGRAAVASAAETATAAPSQTEADMAAARALKAKEDAERRARQEADKAAAKAREEKQYADSEAAAMAAIAAAIEDFRVQSKRPDGAFGPAIRDVRLGMTRTEAEEIIRKNIDVRFTSDIKNYSGQLLGSGKVFANLELSRIIAIHSPKLASQDRVAVVVSRIKLPAPNIKISDLTDELVKAYGQPKRSDARGLGWYAENNCPYPTFGMSHNAAPPPNAEGKRIINNGYVMTDKDIMDNPVRVTTPEATGNQLPNGMLGPPARQPYTDLRGKPFLPQTSPVGCGTAIFAQVDLDGLVLTLIDKMWLDALFYEGQETQRGSAASAVQGILNK